jgi:hypothetical protein
MAVRKKKATKKKATKKKATKKATKKAAKKAPSWGGRRRGAGRPIGSGKGPSPDARYNRVAVMFNNTEIKALKALAAKNDLPIATVAYNLIARNLKRKS